MTITLSTEQKTQQDAARERIVKKLNEIIGGVGGNSNFFKLNREGNFFTNSCSNPEIHNKLVIFLALFADYHFIQYDSYASFGHGVAVTFCIPNTLLPKLSNVLDGIKTIDDINIKISF